MLDHLRRKPTSLLKQLLWWLAVLPLVVTTGPIGALPIEEGGQGTLVTELRAWAEDLDQEFEVEALLDTHDYDAQSIIDFVTREVVFQAYPGVLRGVEGTLAGRAGNSHDQALTLARMLRDAGYDAQILVGALTKTQAQALLRNLASATAGRLSAQAARLKAESSVSLERAAAVARRSGLSPGPLAEEARSYADSLSRIVGGRLDPDELVGRALEDSMTYRWVRYREGAAQPWIEVHPAFPEAKAWGLKFDRAEAEHVDPADLQTLEIEVLIENSDGERHSVTGVWQAPAASLMSKPVTLEFLSDGALAAGSQGNVDEMIDRSEFFFVKVNGSVPAGGKLFDLHGDVLSGTAMEGLNSIFSTANRQVRRAVGALSSAETADGPRSERKRKQLTKVWAEFRLKAPGNEAERVERILFEGEALAEESAAAGRLIQRWDIDVVGVTPLPRYYLARSATNFATALQGFGRLKDYLEEPGVPSLNEFGRRAVAWMDNPAKSRLVYLRQMFDWFQPPSTVVSYPSRPNVLAVRQGFARQSGRWTLYEMADIVSNQRFSFDRAGSEMPRPALEATVARGVWETRAESFRPTAVSEPSRASAYEALTTVPVEDLQDASDSHVVRLATTGADSWWQVDPASGATIGMQDTEAGIGGQATDYLTALTVGVSVVFFAIGTNSCVQATSNVECCFVTNLSIAAVGFALGFSAGLVGIALLGQTAGTAAGAATSVLADMGLSNAPTFCT